MKKFDKETESLFEEYGQACYEVGHGQGRGMEAKTDEKVRDEWEEELRERLSDIIVTPSHAKALLAHFLEAEHLFVASDFETAITALRKIVRSE